MKKEITFPLVNPTQSAKTVFTKCLLLLLLLTGVNEAWAQKTWDGGGDGVNWSSANNWSPNGLPASTDAVTIAAGQTVTVDISTAVCAALNVGSGTGMATLDFNSGSQVTAAGIVTLGQSGNNNRRGTIDMTSGGTLVCRGLALGNASGSNIFTAGAGTVQLTATNTLPSLSTVISSFNNLIMSSGTTTLGLNTAINGTLTQNGGNIAVGSNTLTVNGIHDAGTNTVSGAGGYTLSGTGTLITANTSGVNGTITTTTQSLSAAADYTFNAVAPQNTGTALPTNITGIVSVNSTSTVTLNAAKTIASGGTLNIIAGTFAAGTNLTMASTSSITRSGGTMSGTPQGTGVYNVTYTGNSMTTSAELAGAGLNNITVNLTAAQTLTLDQARTPDGSLSISAGTFNASTFTINRSAAGGTLTVSNGATLKIAGTNALPSNYSTHSIGVTSTIEYAGTGQTISSLNSSQAYGNLTTSGTGTKALQAAITVAGTLSIGSGTTLDVTASNFALNVAGDFTNSGTFNGRTGTVTLNGTAQAIGGSSATTFNNLALSGGTKTFGLSTTVSANLSIATGAVANFGSIATHTANTLTLGGNGTSSGSFGSTSSSTTRKNNTFFTAGTTGLVTITTSSCTAPALTSITVASICAGNITYSIAYAGSTGGPDLYSISGTGINTVTDAALPASPITVNLSSGATVGTIIPTSFTVTNSVTGCTSSNLGGTVTVNENPTLTGTSSSGTTICSGSTATITLSGILNVAQTISYTVGGTAGTQTATVTGSAGSASFNSIALTAANSGQTITITGITRTDVTPNCPFTPVSSNTATLPTVNAGPTLTGTSSSATAVCSGGTATITLSGILNVAQTISYTVGGTAGTQTANVTGVGGSASFSTIALTAANSGQTLTITNIATATCSFIPVTNRTATLPTVNATGTWIGTTTDWFTPSNWCGGAIPTAATDVVIPAGGPQPAISTTGAVCNDLTINAGATLTLGASGSISVSGAFTKTGTLTANATSTFDYAQASGTQTLVANNYGNLTLSGGGAKTFPAGTIGIAGTFTPNSFTTASAGTIDFNGTVSQTIPAFNYNNLTSSSTGARTLASSGTIAVFAAFTAGTNTYTVTGSTVNFTGTGAQTIPAPTPAASHSYNNLTISGNSTKTTAAAFSMSGNLSISTGTLSLNNTASARNYTLAGNFIQSGGVIDFCTSTGQTTINIAGNVTQTGGNFDASGGSAPNGILNFNGTGVQTLNYSTPANNEFIKYTIANGATLQLLSNLNVRRSTTANFQGSLIVSSGGTLNTGTFVISQQTGTGGSGIFTLNAGAKLITANTGGVAAAIVTTNITDTYTAGALYEFNSTVANQSTGFTGLTIGNPRAITISNTFGTVTPDVNITFGNTATLSVNTGATLVAAAARTFTFGTGAVVNVDGTIRTANTTATDALSGSATSTIVNTNTPTINLNSGSVIELNGSAAQFAAARTFAGLTINNASGVTMLGNITTTDLGLTAGNLSVGSNTLTVNGAVSRTGGNLAGSNTSGLTIGGAAGSLFFDQTGTNNFLKNFTINTGASVTLGNALNITGGTSANNEGLLTVTGSGVLTTGGFLTIKSNSNGTAGIAAGNTAGGYISGDVTVERFIPQNASKAWRLLASNTSGQTIKESWQENQTGSNSNTNPGFGTMIPNSGASVGAVQANGYDTLSLGRSIFKYNQTTDDLDPLPNTNSTQLSSEQGYFIFIRGDRSVGQFGAGAASTSTILRSKGTLFQGDQTAISVPAGKYAIVRNPYASRLDLRQVARTGLLVDAYQVWDPKLAGKFGVGAYQNFIKNTSSGNYEVTPGGGSYGANGSVQNFIESGAAFFVQAAAGGAGSVQVLESSKASGSQVVFRPSSPLAGSSRVLFNMFANNVGSTDLVDGGFVDFDDIYSNAVDINDVRKSPNFGENFGILRSNTDLVVERRKSVTANDTIFFNMNQVRPISYRLDFEATGFDPHVINAVLEDKFTGTKTSLDLTVTTSYTFTVTGVAASFAADRFRLVLSLGNTFSGTGNWTDNARWSAGAPPATGDAVTIAAGANATLNTDFTVGASLTMTATSTLTVNPTKTLSVASTGVANLNGQSVTFKSDNTGYGSLGKVLGTLNGATNVTVERYIPNNGFRSWRLLSVPTYGSGQTIRQAWQEGDANPSPLQNNLPGFGTQITGAGSNAAASQSAGFDNAGGSASLLSWNGTAWSSATTTNTPIASQKAWFLYVRGERSKGVSGLVTDASATTLRTNGTVYTGNQVTPVATGSFTVVGNIYLSAIDFTSLTRSNVNNLFYIWDSKKQNGNSLGVYQTFSGTNGFAPTISGGSYNIAVPNTTIESGQAFFVTGGVTPGGGSITLSESAKISGSNGNLGFRPSASPAKISSRLYNANNDMLDANVVVFDQAYANSIDADDAVKLGNPGANFAIEKESRILAIEGRKPIANSDVVQFRMWNLPRQNYKLELVAANMQTTDVTAVLEDKYLQTVTPVDLNSTTAINFAVDANAASSAADRFRIVFKQAKPLPVVAGAANAGVVISPNPVNGQHLNLQFTQQPAGKYSIRLISTTGQLLLGKTLQHAGGNSMQSIELPSYITTGVYELQVATPGNTVTVQKLIVR